MKRIYFVRHGLTFSNEKKQIQDAYDKLSPKGITQAEVLAGRFSKIPFDTLLASDMDRARHTAEMIGEKTGHAVKTSELFREVPYPSAYVGLSLDSNEALSYHAEQASHIHEPTWRLGDEESYHDLTVRAQKAFAYAAEQPGDVLVVTHGKFLRHILFTQLFEGELPADIKSKASGQILTSNTGITVFELHEGKWKLLTWNDHAHLG